MKKSKVSVKSAARTIKAQDAKVLKASKKPLPPGASESHQHLNGVTHDSFQNFAAKLGMGTDNLMSASTYGFNPITRIRTTLEWIHRGSWIGGVAVDIPADDMTRMGTELKGGLDPTDAQKIEKAATINAVWKRLNQTAKWARLYGGALAVMLIDGQDPKTPLRIETIGRKQFKGLIVMDRWMVEPSLENLVTEFGPDLGMPKFYRITSQGPALQGQTVHHSRVIRMDGLELPYWQKLQENLWGLSVLERVYDRMVAFDSATTGAAQLVYKAFLRTLKIKDFKELVAGNKVAADGLAQYVELMRRFQGNEGITVIDAEDSFDVATHSAFGGLSDVLGQLGQQVSGALQIPLTRLFGQAPTGFSSNESDLRNYYDSIHQRQMEELYVPVDRVNRIIARSEGIQVPEDFNHEFRSLYQLTDEQKATVASTVSTAVTNVEERGVISRATALKELRQSSHKTGIFTNITQSDIEEAEQEGPPLAETVEQELVKKGDDPTTPGVEREDDLPPEPKATEAAERAQSQARDSAGQSTTLLYQTHSLLAVIESPKGTHRSGGVLQADYGYLRGKSGADGEAVDVFIGPRPTLSACWVVDQVNPQTGEFDEHKVLIGFATKAEALACYLGSYQEGFALKILKAIHDTNARDVKHWLLNGDLTKPFRE